MSTIKSGVHTRSIQCLNGTANSLLLWFSNNKRDLPWRSTYNPYHVWISEIMLQQTQMERGVSYFLSWIERFPDVDAVASAKETEILKYWEGLGYYSRARNLHKAARQMVSTMSGIVPCEYDTLLSLPGIGPYTAAAIASIAGNKNIAVVDANVCRVYSRLFDIAESIKSTTAQQKIRNIAGKLLPEGKARDFNQAVMDLGGLVCTPRSPKCGVCPISKSCLACMAGTIEKRPVVEKGKKTVLVHNVAGLIYWKGLIYIQQRQADKVWGGLWEFPGGELTVDEKREQPSELVAEKILTETGFVVKVNTLLASVKHQYTHHKVTLDCYLCELACENSTPILSSACNYQWIKPEQLSGYGFPAGPRKVLEYLRQHRSDMLL